MGGSSAGTRCGGGAGRRLLLALCAAVLATASTCPDTCTCFRDVRLWPAMPREESLTARCAHRGLEALPRGIDGDVRHLDVSDNWLERLDDGALLALGLERLRSLDLSANALTHIDAGAFRGLRELRRVSLARNKLRALPPDLFADAPHLWSLSLADNPLALPGDAPLLRAPSLLALDVSRCGLRDFPDGALGEENALQELTAAGNAIAYVHVSQLARLRRLDLSDNHLSHVSAAALAAARELRSLALDGNPLTLFADEPLVSNPSLRELSAGRCGLRRVGRAALSELPLLEELFLDENGVAALPQDALSELPALQRLGLAGNRLQRLPDDVFVANKHLRALDLSRNPLDVSGLEAEEEEEEEGAEEAAWVEAPALRELAVAHCGLRTLPARLFAGVPSLRNLSAPGNELRSVGAELLTALPRLRALDLRGNPLRCDASLRGLRLAAEAQHVRAATSCAESSNGWDVIDINGVAFNSTSGVETNAAAMAAAEEERRSASVLNAVAEGGLRWGPPLGLFLLAVVFVMGLRKWMNRKVHRHHFYAARSKEYVYESDDDDDEAATMTVTTDAGSPRVTPTSPAPPAYVSAISNPGGKAAMSRFAVSFVDEAPVSPNFIGNTTVNPC